MFSKTWHDVQVLQVSSMLLSKHPGKGDIKILVHRLKVINKDSCYHTDQLMPIRADASHLQLFVSAISASSLDDFKVHTSAGILRPYLCKTCYLKVLLLLALVLFKTNLSANCLVPIKSFESLPTLVHGISCHTCGSILIPHSFSALQAGPMGPV